MRKKGIIKQTNFVADLEKQGFTREEAKLAFDTVLQTISQGILDGNAIVLNKILSINSEIKGPETVERFGGEQNIGWRANLKIRQSKVLRDKVREKYDPNLRLDKELELLAKKM